jgi:hypothetical protein
VRPSLSLPGMVVSSHVGKLGMEVATLHPVNEVSIDLQDGPNALHSVQLNAGSQQALPLGQMLDASHTLVHAYAGLVLGLPSWEDPHLCPIPETVL